MCKISAEHFKQTIGGKWEKSERTDYRLELDHENKVIYVTGRGSQDEDWADNLDFRTRAVKWFENEKDILVHAGFLRQYQAVRNKLLDAAYEYSNYTIRVAGFSLGATWTQIFVQDLIHHFPQRDITAIFYAPASPWRKLPKKYRLALNSVTFFVRSIYDPVTWMRILRFYRYGKHINIGKCWRVFPLQHLPAQIIRGLLEKFKE